MLFGVNTVLVFLIRKGATEMLAGKIVQGQIDVLIAHSLIPHLFCQISLYDSREKPMAY